MFKKLLFFIFINRPKICIQNQNSAGILGERRFVPESNGGIDGPSTRNRDTVTLGATGTPITSPARSVSAMREIMIEKQKETGLLPVRQWSPGEIASDARTFAFSHLYRGSAAGT